MKKFLLYLTLTLTLLVFILVMNTGQYLKAPMGKEDNVPRYMKNVRIDIENSEWDSAKKNIKELDSAWHKVIPRIQFSVERTEINQLSVSLARLKGAINTENKAASLIELEEASKHWEQIDK